MPKATMVSAQQLDTLRTALKRAQAQPPPPPAHYTLREVINLVTPEIQDLRNRGYTYKHIVEIIEHNLGVTVGVPALAKLRLKPRRKTAAGKPRPAKAIRDRIQGNDEKRIVDQRAAELRDRR